MFTSTCSACTTPRSSTAAGIQASGRPFSARYDTRPPLPSPKDEGNNSNDDDDPITRVDNLSRAPACVAGGRASGGRGRRPFPRVLHQQQHGEAVLSDSGNHAANTSSRSSRVTVAIGAKATTAVSERSRKAQRGLPLVQWSWPANSGAALARVGSEWFKGATATAPASSGGAGREVDHSQQENSRMIPLQRTTQISSIVVGTVCEPVRPTRLDLSIAQGGRRECPGFVLV